MVINPRRDIQVLGDCCTCETDLEVQELSMSATQFKKLAKLLKALEKELGRKATFEEFRAAMKGEKYDQSREK